MTTFSPLAGKDDPRVVAFLEAWHENNRDHFERRYSNLDYDSYYPKTANCRRKYICLDQGTSGVFMVDKATGEVWGIKAYGKVHHGHFCGRIEDLTREYNEATEHNREVSLR